MIQDTIRKFHEAAASPRAQMEKYMAEGKKIVLTAPVYTPEEIIPYPFELYRLPAD